MLKWLLIIGGAIAAYWYFVMRGNGAQQQIANQSAMLQSPVSHAALANPGNDVTALSNLRQAVPVAHPTPLQYVATRITGITIPRNLGIAARILP